MPIDPNRTLSYHTDMVDESVGQKFSEEALQLARDQTLKVIVDAAKEVKPGMTEAEAKALLQSIQAERGAPKSWHPPQIRFGKNTLLAFGEKSEAEVRLQEDDIFFFDIGPIFDDHEGDVGRAFSIGGDKEMKRCCEDVEAIWNEVRNHWVAEKVSGAELYAFAEKASEARGWVLSLKKAAGHRIADFPHTARRRGSIEKLEYIPATNRWILEIQIRHPEKPFGAFFEDLLN